MAGVFIQLYSQVIDFSTFFPSLKWKFTTVSVIYGFKKATQSCQLAKSNSKYSLSTILACGHYVPVF